MDKPLCTHCSGWLSPFPALLSSLWWWGFIWAWIPQNCRVYSKDFFLYRGIFLSAGKVGAPCSHRGGARGHVVQPLYYRRPFLSPDRKTPGGAEERPGGGVADSGVMYLVLVLTAASTIRFRPLFTPMVNGTFLILMPLSLSATVIRGILGIDGFLWQGVLAALVAVVVIVFVSLKAQGFLQSISVLCGLGAGWLAAVVLGVRTPSFWAQHHFLP
jgi:hypothetical protein